MHTGDAMRKCKCLFHHIQSFSFSATLLYCLSGAFVVSAADAQTFIIFKGENIY